MKIWRLNEPRGSGVACFSIAGTWTQMTPRQDLCPQCGSPPSVALRPPFVIEWLPYGDLLADFMWSQGGMGAPVLRSSIAHALAATFRGFAIAELRMVQKSNLRVPASRTKRTKPRVWLPYSGPPLAYFDVTTSVQLDTEHSTGHFQIHCTTCGRRDFVPEGVEEHSVEYGPYRSEAESLDASIERTRRPGAGLYVHATDLGSSDVFRVCEVAHLRFCTDRFRDFVLANRYSNIEFWEYGEAL